MRGFIACVMTLGKRWFGLEIDEIMCYWNDNVLKKEQFCVSKKMRHMTQESMPRSQFPRNELSSLNGKRSIKI